MADNPEEDCSPEPPPPPDEEEPETSDESTPELPPANPDDTDPLPPIDDGEENEDLAWGMEFLGSQVTDCSLTQDKKAKWEDSIFLFLLSGLLLQFLLARIKSAKN